MGRVSGDTGGGFRSRLQSHSADIAVAQRDAHVSHPPGGSLCRLALGATKQVGVGIDPDVPAQQILVFAPGKQLEDVTALAPYLFLADEAEIIIVRRDVGGAVIFRDFRFSCQHAAIIIFPRPLPLIC